MGFLTDFELEHLEHESLRVKYRELQRTVEGLIGEQVVCDILNELQFGYGVIELESYGRPTCREIAAKILDTSIPVTNCNCVEDNNAMCEECISDEQALEDTQKRHEQSVTRDTAKGINGYGDCL